MDLGLKLKQIATFTKRDFYSWTTYKTAMVTQLINIFVGVFSWGVRAAYVQKPVPEMYGSDYISSVSYTHLTLPTILLV